MDHYLLAYIDQRMAEWGYKHYHHEPVALLTDKNKAEYRVPAYNEHFFLVSKNLANGTIIRSDINIYDADQYYAGLNFYQIQEFKGLIVVTNPARTTQLLEFIRVIPKL